MIVRSDMIRSFEDLENIKSQFVTGQPFHHVVIDNFLMPDAATAIAAEFPDYDSKIWYSYDNPIENKRTMNSWDRFGKNTYRLFWYLNTPEFIQQLEKMTGIQGLMPDIGLNGGGLHIHRRGGKLNVHQDYSIHPKLGLERRLNLIVYLSESWNSEWGGGLQLWTHDDEGNSPKEVAKTVEIQFNRAVLFDTTQNSWHGLPDSLNCPEGTYRKSLAIYYLTPPRVEASKRGKALFAPHLEQKNDQAVLELIRARSGVETAETVYRS